MNKLQIYNYFYNISLQKKGSVFSSYLKRTSLLSVNHLLRSYRVSWGYTYYTLAYNLVFYSLIQRMQGFYGYGFFEHEKRILPLVFSKERQEMPWFSMYRFNEVFYNAKQMGALIIRATLNNFFLTFLRGSGFGEVATYISAGVVEIGLARKRRSDYIARLTSEKMAKRIKRRYKRVKKIYLFFSGPICKRSLQCMAIFKKFRYFFVNMYFTHNVAHNGLRPPKPRRKKKLN